jgi:ADP-heptose:LPS heptosyltransferase
MRRIGVVWRASPDNMTSPQRSMAAACLAPLATLEDTQFINLQGGPADGRDALARVLPGSFDPLASGEPPLDEFAAAIAATDLLVTIDTMALHLAGSMGHPCWAMLPHAPSFYWGTDGDGCAWYPGMRCFRQTRRGDWSGPVEAVRDALATC